MSKKDKPVVEASSLPHLASRVFDTPLMVSRQKLEIILSVLGPRFGLDVPQLTGASGAGPAAHREFKILESGVAVIPILGSLVHRTAGLEALSGLTSYCDISKQFEMALESPQVSAILFDMDTPGGEANAVFDLSDQIFEARGEKPIIAVANEQMYSSGYAIGSAADEIYISRTAGVGSIGVIAAHMDISERDKQNGIKVTTIFAGDRKNDFNPHEELSSEALKILQDHIDVVYGEFVETVARNRGLSTKAVRDTQAGFFIGKSAVKAELADGVMSASEAFDKAATQKRSTFMATKKPTIAGSNLVKFLSNSIDASATDDKPRDHVIADMAASASIEASAVTSMLTDGVDSPPIEQLQGFADALGVSMEDVVEAAKLDGFAYALESKEKEPTPTASNVIDLDKARSEGKQTAAAELHATAKAINEMCVIAGAPALAGDMIARQLTVDAARTELFQKKADAGDQSGITSSIDGLNNGLPSVAASWDAAFKKIGV